MHSTMPACPNCTTPHAPHDTACAVCGLVFGSQSATTSGPRCPRCGQPQRSGARICGHCGTVLGSSYRALQTGEVLDNGRYEIRHILSQGGMGAIYLAIDHHTFRRTVVIKAMLD